MLKNWRYISIISTAIILGIILGLYIYNMNNKEENKEYRSNMNTLENIESENNTIQTSSNEEKVSPNAKIVKRIYYKKCDHLIELEENIAKVDVNKKEEEIKDKYIGWKLEDFDKSKIILFKELNKTCSQHYKIKDEDGVIVIYQANENGRYRMIDRTEINTKYLSEDDQLKLKEGIELIGESRLNSSIEDYE